MVETLDIVQAHSQAVDSARSVSKVTVEFFKTLDTHATKLTGIVEEAQAVNHRKLSEFENKFEVIRFLTHSQLQISCVSFNAVFSVL